MIRPMNTKACIQRSELYQNIRTYFKERKYLELETPSLSPDLIPEPTIDNFETTFINEFCGSRNLYLIPSPEVFMKKVIAEERTSVFQISKCFRNCEQLGSIHNPEFSMLEYYTVDFDENDSIELTKDFLKKTAIAGAAKCITENWLEMTVCDAVLKYANVDLDMLQNISDLRKAALDLNMVVSPSDSWDDIFNMVFCNFVETAIPKDRPVLFKDYPKQIKCLAKENGNYRRRWELYIGGIEVANCYYEEDDPSKVQEYYREEYQKLISLRSENGKPIPDCDDNYWEIFKTFPKCSGVAIGLDRLLMAEGNYNDIKDVLLFPYESF